MIKLKDINKTFQIGDEEIKALDHVNFSVERGEFVSIIGPSRFGKININEYFRFVRCANNRDIYFKSSRSKQGER